MKTKVVHATVAVSSMVFAVALFALTDLSRAEDSKLTSKDKSFITDASEAGASEIQQSEIAHKKANNTDVKSFAVMMMDDHKRIGGQLEKIVTPKGGEVSNSPGVTQKAAILVLEAKNGDAFDKAYADSMVSDHKKAVELFEKASKDLDDPELRGFAKETLPTLKHHLEEAEKLADKLGK